MITHGIREVELLPISAITTFRRANRTIIRRHKTNRRYIMQEFTMHGTGFLIWTGFVIVATVFGDRYIPKVFKKFLGNG